ncbi:MAG: hypothetical protein WDN72_08080 [Alphaproteobacteria bacterium]
MTVNGTGGTHGGGGSYSDGVSLAYSTASITNAGGRLRSPALRGTRAATGSTCRLPTTSRPPAAALSRC